MKIGIISDTHGLLRPEVEALLRDCGCILHAGDAGDRKVLEKLRRIAPVKAVRGNADKDLTELPDHLELELEGLHIYMTHKKKDLPADLAKYDLAVYGHSHQYAAEWLEKGGHKRTLLINPGSCGPRRFRLPVTMAVLIVQRDGWQVKRIGIPGASPPAVPDTAAHDLRRVIEIVIRETQKGQSVGAIAERHGLDEALTEQIVRLYVTHPGVTADGIMTKMGL